MSEEEEREQEDEEDEEEEPGGNERTSAGSLSTLVQQSLPSDAVKIQSLAQDEWTGSSEGKTTTEI